MQAPIPCHAPRPLLTVAKSRAVGGYSIQRTREHRLHAGQISGPAQRQGQVGQDAPGVGSVQWSLCRGEGVGGGGWVAEREVGGGAEEACAE